LSRQAIFNAVDASLKRLDTPYIDLLQIHRFDPNTPLEETMEALHDLVKSGKVRYIGASSMWATQFAQLQFVAEKNGWTKFVSMQNHYNLLYREEEREMNRFCDATGVGLIPVSIRLRSTSIPGVDKNSGHLSAVAISQDQSKPSAQPQEASQN
jgi:aryl-alcohol dehydrogenase-like predicted oxidoreductase